MPYSDAIITPARAASAEPIMKVAEITKFGFTPIRLATFGFSAIARIARPSLVLCTSNSKPPITRNATTMIVISVIEITAPGLFGPDWITLIGSVGSSCGNGSGLRDQIIMASVCSRIDTPMAVISGARRGARRKGR